MLKSEIQIRVRYGETDQMGYVYYGNFASYFEVARVETLRQTGLSYKKIEEEGVLLPVLDYKVKFIKPAFYDELLTIRTTISDVSGARIHFLYEVINEKEELVATGETTLVFIDKQTRKPCKVPDEIIQKLLKIS